ncbi:DUF1987 domain-containing protein [Nafulsella turpanensis]|uniref:DUF1987 domain-containing protein n=1 Tax=Nafulsella turpanensis TaxID=1265690 RepID=UPI000346D959|nr:DUF1987 domain-containing protein [Nafulsella turpanensis]
MKTLEISAKDASPFIRFDPYGKLQIKGKSFGEDIIYQYSVLMNKIQEFAASGKKSLEVYIYLKYFNTVSLRCLFDLVTAIKGLQEKAGVKVRMEWNYIEGDDSMKEEIEEFKNEIGLDFQVLPEKDFLGGVMGECNWKCVS